MDRSLEARSGETADRFGTGAGDQGMMFGFACDETPELLPLPIALSHALARQLAAVRKSGRLPFLRPDGKSQVTVEYVDGRPRRVDTVVLSAQHDEMDMDELAAALTRHVIRPVLPEALTDAHTRILINPTGRFVIGGPQGDVGLTGRKDHRRYLRRLRPPRRRLLLRQGPDQGGPQRGLRGAVCGQEPRGGGAGAPL